MKKIVAILLLLVTVVACAACAQMKTSKTPEEKMFTYTISNETGKTVDKAFVADDNSFSKSEVVFTEGGLENGGTFNVSLAAVPDKDGLPSLTVSYTIGNTEYMTKMHDKEGTIRLTAESENTAAPQK
ncbi:MAG: hypothetical protein IJI38_01025 [Clostridia bacterium]|nr:hypothetical protein [Clostridia bacterium]